MKGHLASQKRTKAAHDPNLLVAIQHKVAISALPASALRGQRAPGLISIAREACEHLPLGQFGVASGKVFAERLDRYTAEMLAAFPRKARHWGVARKALNLFLRDAYYNQFLAAKYNLNRAAAHFELPLDSKTAAKLHEEEDGHLPAWRGVKYLTAAQSAEYQLAATDLALDYDCHRVHLDAHIWPQQ